MKEIFCDICGKNGDIDDFLLMVEDLKFPKESKNKEMLDKAKCMTKEQKEFLQHIHICYECLLKIEKIFDKHKKNAYLEILKLKKI